MIASPIFALRTLLGNTIDYAGTFPPAKLGLSEALYEASCHQNNLKYPWVYSKMVLPFDQIKTLGSVQLSRVSRSSFPWFWSALCSYREIGASSEHRANHLRMELKEISKWNEKQRFSSYYSSIQSYELKLKSEELEEVLEVIRQCGVGLNIIVYLEFENLYQLSFSVLSNTIEKIQSFQADNAGLKLGLKLRTGGEKIPETALVAHFVHLALQNSLLFKATQGLHHAITHGEQYGFLNLLLAINLAAYQGFSEFTQENFEQCLRETDRDNFNIAAHEVGWKEFNLPADGIEKTRRYHGTTFGSCSLKEPDDSIDQLVTHFKLDRG